AITTAIAATTIAATAATMATTLTQRLAVLVRVKRCTSFKVPAMIIMVFPEGIPPAFARSSATFFAASSASRAVAVSALLLRSLEIRFISEVASLLGGEEPRRAGSARSMGGILDG